MSSCRRIYLASSWKNEGELIALAGLLRTYCHQVDLFCDSSSGRYVFSWRELAGGDPTKLDMVTMMKHEQTQRAFAEDKRWLDWADTVVLVLPCGRSAHLEAGYAKGQGKRLAILGERVPGEWEVMYGFADIICSQVAELLEWLMDGAAMEAPHV